MKSQPPQLTTIGILLLSFLIGLAGCTSHRPSPKTPEEAPPIILVEGDSLPSISFDELFTDVPGGRVIGYHYEGLQYTRTYQNVWDENFENETKEFNFLAQDILGDAGYWVKQDGLGELRLQGTVRKLSYNIYTYKGSFDQAECEMKWELFLAGEEKPFFTRLTDGAGRVDDNKPGALRIAFERALHRLMAQEEFVEAVAAKQ